jgi:hypothetical protein
MPQRQTPASKRCRESLGRERQIVQRRVAMRDNHKRIADKIHPRGRGNKLALRDVIHAL